MDNETIKKLAAKFVKKRECDCAAKLKAKVSSLLQEQRLAEACKVVSEDLGSEVQKEFSKLQRQIDTLKLKAPLNTSAAADAPQDPTNERLIKELQKQVKCYRSELVSLQKSDAFKDLENYQKLATDYNRLFDFYSVSKKQIERLNREV